MMCEKALLDEDDDGECAWPSPPPADTEDTAESIEADLGTAVLLLGLEGVPWGAEEDEDIVLVVVVVVVVVAVVMVPGGGARGWQWQRATDRWGAE